MNSHPSNFTSLASGLNSSGPSLPEKKLSNFDDTLWNPSNLQNLLLLHQIALASRLGTPFINPLAGLSASLMQNPFGMDPFLNISLQLYQAQLMENYLQKNNLMHQRVPPSNVCSKEKASEIKFGQNPGQLKLSGFSEQCIKIKQEGSDCETDNKSQNQRILDNSDEVSSASKNQEKYEGVISKEWKLDANGDLDVSNFECVSIDAIFSDEEEKAAKENDYISNKTGLVSKAKKQNLNNFELTRKKIKKY